jgi:hypothetical protein
MKAIQALLIVVLLVVGLATVVVTPSVGLGQNPSSFPATTMNRSGHLFFPPGIVPLSDPVDCAGGGC